MKRVGDLNSKYRTYMIVLFKIVIVTVPIYLLLQEDQFDLTLQLGVLDTPVAFFTLFIVWFVSFILLVALRWVMIARILGLSLPIKFALYTHMAGVFLSSWLPGSIGGDVWKAYRFGQLRKLSSEKKGPAYLSVFLDRAMGLFALIVWGAVCILWNYDVWNHSDYGVLADGLVGLAVLLSLIGMVLFITPFTLPGFMAKTIANLEQKTGVLNVLFQQLHRIRMNKISLIYSLLISLVIQAVNVFFLMLIAEYVTGLSVPFVAVSGIFAISLIVTILSLAPGGLGVGHFMFFVLFEAQGIPNGADIFNVFFVVITLFSAIGIFPYFWSDTPKPDTPKKEAYLDRNLKG